MSRPARRVCVFCEAVVPLEREHVFPNWLKNLFSNVQPDFEHHTYSRSWIATPITTGVRREQGYLFSRKKKVVCKGCNHGWMKDLEDAANPLLKRMFRGDAFDLDPAESTTLAAWAWKTAYVVEHLNHQTMTTQAWQRHAFYASRVPPQHSRVWLTHHADNEWTVRAQHLFVGRREMNAPPAESVRDTKLDTMCFGNVAFFVSCTAHHAPFEPSGVLPRGIAELWPRAGTTSWPLPVTVHVNEWEAVDQRLADWVSPSRRGSPPQYWQL